MTMRKLRSVFVKKNHRGALTAHKTMDNDERTAALRSRLLLAAQKPPILFFASCEALFLAGRSLW